MHWRNTFLWVLTCHNLFKWLRILRQFLSPPGLFAPKNPLYTVLAATSAASLLVILGILSASDISAWSCPTRGNLELLGQSVFSYDSLLNKLQMCEKQKGSFIFQDAFFPFSQSGVKKKKKNFTNTWIFLFAFLSPFKAELGEEQGLRRGKADGLREHELPRIRLFSARFDGAAVICTCWKSQHLVRFSLTMPKTLQISIVSEVPVRTKKSKWERFNCVADLYQYNPTAYFSEDLEFHLS